MFIISFFLCIFYHLLFLPMLILPVGFILHPHIIYIIYLLKTFPLQFLPCTIFTLAYFTVFPCTADIKHYIFAYFSLWYFYHYTIYLLHFFPLHIWTFTIFTTQSFIVWLHFLPLGFFSFTFVSIYINYLLSHIKSCIISLYIYWLMSFLPLHFLLFT